MGTKAAVSVAAKHSNRQGSHALPLNTPASAGLGTNREDRQPAQRACFTGACWCTSALSPDPCTDWPSSGPHPATPGGQGPVTQRFRARAGSMTVSGGQCRVWLCSTGVRQARLRRVHHEGSAQRVSARHAGRRPQEQHSRQLIRTYECNGMYVLSLSCAPCKKTRTHVPTST